MPTKIEWTEETWNPITGCTSISEGCQNCYARRAAYSGRLRGRFGYPADEPFGITYHGDRIQQPFRWRKPRRIFVCSMGDLMHAEVEAQWIRQVILTMIRTPRHTYQILTKRPARLLTFAWPVNCWVGVTVESRKHITRIDDLRMTKAQIRFVSFEPLLEGIPSRILDLRQIDWVIVGAETGPGKRPMKPAWASNIGWQCLDADVPFFFKRGSDGRRELFGHRYEEMPSFNGGGYQCRNAR